MRGPENGGYLQSTDIKYFVDSSKAAATAEAGYWWAPAPYMTYDKDRYFLPYDEFDGFGNQTTTTYDSFSLLKQSVTDAMKNQTSVNNDYRVLQPHRISDPNDSITDIHFDTHGLVVASAIEGHLSETGDQLAPKRSYEIKDKKLKEFFEDPIGLRQKLIEKTTTRIIYDPLAYYRSALEYRVGWALLPDRHDSSSQCDGQEWLSYDQSFQPVWSCVLARQKHVNQDASPDVEVTFAYTDGFFQEGQIVRLNQVVTASSSQPQPAQTPRSKPKTKNQRRAQGLSLIHI